MEENLTNCTRKRKCDRVYKHPGSCNNKKVQCSLEQICSKQDGHINNCDTRNVWFKTPQVVKKIHKKEVAKLVEKKFKLDVSNFTIEANISENENLVGTLLQTKAELTNDITELNEECKRLDALVTPTLRSKLIRIKNPTTQQMIDDEKFRCTRSERMKKTKDILEYIHGGEDGAVLGACEFVRRYATPETIEKFVLSLQKGKFVEKLYGRFNDTFQKSDQGINQAVASKYQLYLSRRKYTYLCKIQEKTFNVENQTWIKNCISYGEKNIMLCKKPISDRNVEQFVKTLDIGDIHTLPGYCGAFRSVTALTTMILDLHLRTESLCKKLIWFNNDNNKFIIEFSDDGAPESKDESMCIGSLTCWNFGKRVRSRSFHYPLHTITANEKDGAVALLWQQHTEEMMLLEGNTMTINGRKVTLEFRPSADQAWQFWANNELTQSATYPSMYAKVHKSELQKIGGKIGETWEVATMESREQDLLILDNYRKTLDASNLSKENYHNKELMFMASNCIRQLGQPRIGIYADLQMADPLHLEVNNWEHVLYTIYLEALRNNKMEEFLYTLGASLDNGGCNLKFIAAKIREHFSDKKHCFNKFKGARLIGAQAINLARYSLRLIDAIKSNNSEYNYQSIKLISLSKICQSLRKVGTLMNSVSVSMEAIEDLKEKCRLYFNLFALFHKDLCNSTVWTIGHAIPYHADLLYTKYGVGYGILSMQGKESKHSAMKAELKNCSNRSRQQDAHGKWHQLARGSFVRDFYLAHHYPIDTYVSHSQSRNPPIVSDENGIICECFRFTLNENMCDECINAIDIVNSGNNGCFSDEIMNVIKPVRCDRCKKQLPDISSLPDHACLKSNMKPNIPLLPLFNMSVSKLKEELSMRGCSTQGRKEILIERLEGLL